MGLSLFHPSLSPLSSAERHDERRPRPLPAKAKPTKPKPSQSAGIQHEHPHSARAKWLSPPPIRSPGGKTRKTFSTSIIPPQQPQHAQRTIQHGRCTPFSTRASARASAKSPAVGLYSARASAIAQPVLAATAINVSGERPPPTARRTPHSFAEVRARFCRASHAKCAISDARSACDR